MISTISKKIKRMLIKRYGGNKGASFEKPLWHYTILFPIELIFFLFEIFIIHPILELYRSENKMKTFKRGLKMYIHCTILSPYWIYEDYKEKKEWEKEMEKNES